jgi:hypothetical protein
MKVAAKYWSLLMRKDAQNEAEVTLLSTTSPQ